MHFALALLCVTLASALPSELGGDKQKWGDDQWGGDSWEGPKDNSVKVVSGGKGGGVGGSVGSIGVGTGGGGGGNCDPVACDIKHRYDQYNEHHYQHQYDQYHDHGHIHDNCDFLPDQRRMLLLQEANSTGPKVPHWYMRHHLSRHQLPSRQRPRQKMESLLQRRWTVYTDRAVIASKGLMHWLLAVQSSSSRFCLITFNSFLPLYVPANRLQTNFYGADQSMGEKAKTYNSEDSLVVTHPTTNSPACGLSTAERTGSPIFHTLWSYVLCYG
ncbi:hypothetical protein VN97_g10809 [Penicillium thymicola]|uniref:Uncharacterized protein n=1 Tax=Penicillium thymicola TaxID=293382 RepID=A0AAI9T9U0_PENTH|nr:hypothetical protein VN97_g10809 [Penicillium thymicola]